MQTLLEAEQVLTLIDLFSIYQATVSYGPSGRRTGLILMTKSCEEFAISARIWSQCAYMIELGATAEGRQNSLFTLNGRGKAIVRFMRERERA